MPRTTWYNDNEFRAYPFIEGLYPYDDGEPILPLDAVVDCGFLLTPTTDFDLDTDTIQLLDVQRTASQLVFRFASTAMATTGKQLLFAVDADAERYTQVTATLGWSDEISASFSLSECGELVDWEGFIVIGNLATLKAKLPIGETLEVAAVVEPTSIISLKNTYITSIYVANEDRTRRSAPAGCDPLVWPHDLTAVPVRGCCAGPVRLIEGYNCRLVVSALDNSITVNAVEPATDAATEGPPPGEVPQYSGEAPPEGRSRLDGALHCYEVFRAINGLPGPVVEIEADSGVTLHADPERNTLIADVHMISMAVCPSEGIGPDDEVSCSPCDPCGEVGHG